MAPPASVGPSRIPARISPVTAGWPSLRASTPNRRAATTMTASASISSGRCAGLTIALPSSALGRGYGIRREFADSAAGHRASHDPDGVRAVLDLQSPAALGQLQRGERAPAEPLGPERGELAVSGDADLILVHAERREEGAGYEVSSRRR